jgi:hypothetical protein
LIFIFISVVVIRFICVATMGLTPQDAYYYYYSEQLELSYFDHPPMIAWCLKLFSIIFGKEVWVIKMADFTVTLLTLYAFYHLAGMYLSKSRNNIALLLLGSTILVTILSISSAPDVPLMLFWTISLIFLTRAIFEGKLRYWLFSGISIGLAFNSKYTAVFLLIGLFVFLLLSKQYRKLLFSKAMFLLLISFSVTILPVVIWNVQHDFVSFRFQTDHRAQGISWRSINPLYFIGTMGHQLLLLLPVFLAALFMVFLKLIRRVIRTRIMIGDRKLFLISFSLPLFLFFFSASFLMWVKINWMMPAYISSTILLAIFIRKKYFSTQMLTSLLFHILLLVQIVLYPVSVKSDDTWWGWDKLNGEVKEIRTEYPGYFIFSNDGYKTTAILNFYDQEVYAGNVLGENALEFSIRDSNLNHLVGRNAIFIDSEPNFKNDFKGDSIPLKLKEYFSSVEEISPIILKNKAQKTLRKFRLYKCENYSAQDQSAGNFFSLHIMKPKPSKKTP